MEVEKGYEIMKKENFYNPQFIKMHQENVAAWEIYREIYREIYPMS